MSAVMTFPVCRPVSLFLCVSVCIAACCAGTAAAPSLSNDILLSHSYHSQSGFPLVCSHGSTQSGHRADSNIPHPLPNTQTPTPSTNLKRIASGSGPTALLPYVCVLCFEWVFRRRTCGGSLCSVRRARFGSLLAEDGQCKSHTADFQAPL